MRQATAELNRLHSSASAQRTSRRDEGGSFGLTEDEAIANKALETIAGAHAHWVNIAALIPKGEFYRYVAVCMA